MPKSKEWSNKEKEEFRKTILVDFDGVIHRMLDNTYDVEGKPIEGAQRAITLLVGLGYKIVILTARPATDFKYVRRWLKQYFVKDISDQIEVTNIKRPGKFIIDDRAIRFTNWDDMLNYLR